MPPERPAPPVVERVVGLLTRPSLEERIEKLEKLEREVAELRASSQAGLRRIEAIDAKITRLERARDGSKVER